MKGIREILLSLVEIMRQHPDSTMTDEVYAQLQEILGGDKRADNQKITGSNNSNRNGGKSSG